MTKKDNIIIFDTTLRDGEQSPGATMNMEEKILIAETLDKMGVDIIEAGFAIASKGDFECVQSVDGYRTIGFEIESIGVALVVGETLQRRGQ